MCAAERSNMLSGTGLALRWLQLRIARRMPAAIEPLPRPLAISTKSGVSLTA